MTTTLPPSTATVVDFPAAQPAPQSGFNFGKARAVWLDQVLADPEITPADFVIAYLIGRHLNAETFSAFPGACTLAEHGHVTVKTAYRSLRKLKERGHIAAESIARNKASVLTPLINSESGPAIPSKLSTKTNSAAVNTSNPPWPADHIEQFWNAYPRKEGKGAVANLLNAMAKRREPAWDVIIIAARRFAARSRGKDPKYIPMPKNWLADARWADKESVASDRAPDGSYNYDSRL
jgi:hypothetical protein